MKIVTKKQMYAALKAGEFGNTIPQYMSVQEWEASEDCEKYPLWGVRSGLISAHPACRLYCPREEVAAYANQHFPLGANISMMVDSISTVRAWLEIIRLPQGLTVEGVLYPPVHLGWNWRNSMRDSTRRRGWAGSAAIEILRTVLNENSFFDLMVLMEKYQDHVVELSALEECIGSIKGRNAVVWEVRSY